MTATRDENKLNMLYADVFTEDGKAKRNEGKPISTSDLDEAKLRKLVVMPETAVLKRVVDRVKKQLDALKDEAAREAATSAPPDPGKLEEGGSVEFRERQQKIADYTADVFLD